MYINDLPQVLNEAGSYHYANDTCIFYQGTDNEKKIFRHSSNFL